jgi:hypothetical protein
MSTLILTAVPGSLPMMDLDHGSMGSKGIVTLTSHMSKPLGIDMRQG